MKHDMHGESDDLLDPLLKTIEACAIKGQDNRRASIYCILRESQCDLLCITYYDNPTLKVLTRMNHIVLPL